MSDSEERETKPFKFVTGKWPAIDDKWMGGIGHHGPELTVPI